jgi:serine/threonine-protein kinase
MLRGPLSRSPTALLALLPPRDARRTRLAQPAASGHTVSVELSPGLRLHDRYRLAEQIGAGGMSEVWRADDEVLGRSVAVKVLASPLAADPDLRAATQREARAAARLAHPHVTQVYDYGEASLDGGATVPYLVMELVEGESLADRLARGPLPWQSATRVAAQIAAALAAAHRLGVVHRDIKPGNVMLTATGAKVLDFGIATLAGVHPEHDGGLLIGTPAYAAPERLRPGGADPAADVYGLGAVLYTSLTGRAPIAAGTWDEAAAAHERGVPVSAPQAPGLPSAVAALCLACLSPDAGQRPGAEAVAGRLTTVLGDAAAGPGTDQVVPGSSAGANPATLVDRSLAGAALTAYGERSGARSHGPAGYARGGPRIAASAPVPARPAAWDEPEPQALAAPPRRSPLALVGLAGAIIAAGIALTLVAMSLRPTPNNKGAAPGSAVTAPNSASAAPSAAASSPTARPLPTTATGIVDEINLILTEAVAAGEISPEAAQELNDKLDDVRRRIADGRPKDVSRQAADLREKIVKAAADGNISRGTADRLTLVLSPLIANADNGNNGNGNSGDGGGGDD